MITEMFAVTLQWLSIYPIRKDRPPYRWSDDLLQVMQIERPE
jgi:hypothetical protein